MLTQVNIRITRIEKEAAEEKAKRLGMSLSELIRESLKKIQVKDRRTDTRLINAIHRLTLEMNRIGNNINQVTRTINQLKGDYGIPVKEISEFNEHLKSYNDSRIRLFNQIKKVYP